MSIVSIDIETAGLDPTCSVLEFAAVVDLRPPEGELLTYHQLIDNPHGIRGEPFALAMHKELLSEIASSKLLMDLDEIGDDFACWLKKIYKKDEVPKVSVVGKNFGMFDWNFLKYPFRNLINVRHRVFDVGNLFWDPTLDGSVLPDLDTCCTRAGLIMPVKHRALPDALVVSELMRYKWRQLSPASSSSSPNPEPTENSSNNT